VENGCMDEGSYQPKGVEKFKGDKSHYVEQLLEGFFNKKLVREEKERVRDVWKMIVYE